MKCYRKILRISWKEKKRNSDIINTLKIPECWLLNTIAKRKLHLFGHIKRKTNNGGQSTWEEEERQTKKTMD